MTSQIGFGFSNMGSRVRGLGLFGFTYKDVDVRVKVLGC